MEFVGEENRIQALFRELRLKDEHFTPRFSAVWNRAQLSHARPRSSFGLAFVTATLLLAGALFSVAWWSRYWQGRQPSIAGASQPPVRSVNPAPAAVKSEVKYASAVQRGRRSISRSRSVRFAARPQAELLAENRSISDAGAISSWQSPTNALLRSPGDEVLTSLPQLDAGSNELKSFLPGRSN